jgi:tetratricopeptide (TPR) repeat protein
LTWVTWIARLCISLALTIAIASANAARAQSSLDRVHRHNGVDSGQVTAINPLGVTISRSGIETTISVEDIEGVYLAGEPADLNSARTALQAGRPRDALRVLEGIAAAGVSREEIVVEIEFYKLLAQTQLALAGQGDRASATTAARGFLTRRRTSFHVPQAIELVGDLLMAAGHYGEARSEYAKLAKARSTYFELRSALLVGRAWQAEEQHEQALKEFEKVVGSSASGPPIEALKLSATLDRAVSQAADGEGENAAATIAAIIAEADPEDDVLLARAYNALGDCYRQAGDVQGALFAFLHVDLLYNDAADAHAKALHELVTLWREAGRDNRSQEAAQELAQKYPSSRWAKP